MKLADYLRLDVPLPTDPFEALIATRARKARLAEKVATVMSNLFPDWDDCIETIEQHEEHATRLAGGVVEGGDA
jgi:hypothetical protein